LHFNCGDPKEKRAKVGVSILIKTLQEIYYDLEGSKWKCDKVTLELILKKFCILGIYAISDDENAAVREDLLVN